MYRGGPCVSHSGNPSLQAVSCLVASSLLRRQEQNRTAPALYRTHKLLHLVDAPYKRNMCFVHTCASELENCESLYSACINCSCCGYFSVTLLRVGTRSKLFFRVNHSVMCGASRAPPTHTPLHTKKKNIDPTPLTAYLYAHGRLAQCPPFRSKPVQRQVSTKALARAVYKRSEMRSERSTHTCTGFWEAWSMGCVIVPQLFFFFVSALRSEHANTWLRLG